MNIPRTLGRFHSFRVALPLAATVLALPACAPSFPKVAASAPSDAAFKAGIATRFPPGTRAVVLRRELAGEGFTFLDDPARRLHSALIEGDNLPCYSQVRIDWREDRRGRIVEIQAARFDCS